MSFALRLRGGRTEHAFWSLPLRLLLPLVLWQAEVNRQSTAAWKMSCIACSAAE
jgi:hypothetical protein